MVAMYGHGQPEQVILAQHALGCLPYLQDGWHEHAEACCHDSHDDESGKVLAHGPSEFSQSRRQ
jgi:hypothetical protein